VGRPNVGKSTLFNCLTKTRNAIVADLPGVTRDRQYGEGKFQNIPYVVIDTGGIDIDEATGIPGLMGKQARQAIDEADIILFVVDAKEGLTVTDQKISHDLRQLGKKVYLVVNKIEGSDPNIAKSDFYQLGFPDLFDISAAHHQGINIMLAAVLNNISFDMTSLEQEQVDRIKIAIVGRPNVGKSTLVNRILGEERVIVYDAPGTTRDSIFIPFERNDLAYTLIDTAGVRRKSKVYEAVEKFSVIKTLKAIEIANVVIFLIDARENILDQDLKLLDFVIEAGKALVLAVNKWDGMSEEDRRAVKNEIHRRLGFISFAEINFISALHGSGVGNLFKAINQAYESAMKPLPTPLLTRILQSAIKQHQPPLSKGRRIKLRYAHLGGHNPPIIVIHGTQTENLPDDYIRYLTNFFLKNLNLKGTPIRIELKSTTNPYEGKKNILTPRQRKKRQRLLKHIKKDKK
jgi:GTP-binding protein